MRNFEVIQIGNLFKVSLIKEHNEVAGEVAQVVEHLLAKHEALVNPQYYWKRKE
jgi:hypothetical protein